MCEIARNSVLQSGFEHKVKKRWLGDQYLVAGPAGNDIHKTNVPNVRMTYRYQTLMEERLMVLSELRELSKTNTEQSGVRWSETDNGSSVVGETMSSSPHFGNLPGEPLLEHVLKMTPDFYAHSHNLPPLSALNIGGPALNSLDNRASFSGVSILAQRLAREGGITSLLDQGFKEYDGDGDDIWE